MSRRILDVEYRLYMPKTMEWIKETSAEDIWLKTQDKSESFYLSDYDFITDILVDICRDKNLEPHKDIVVLKTVTYEEDSYV